MGRPVSLKFARVLAEMPSFQMVKWWNHRSIGCGTGIFQSLRCVAWAAGGQRPRRQIQIRVDSGAWLGGGKLWGAFKGGRGKLTAAKSLVFNHSIAWSTFARCERADLQMFEPINYCQRSERAFLSAKGKRQHSGGNRGEVQKLNATQNEPIVRIGHQYHHLAPFGPSRWVKSFKIICKTICKII